MEKEQALVRLIQSIEYLKNKGQARNQNEMAELMGVRQPHLAAAIRGDQRRLTEGFLRRFAAAYSDYIDEGWLLTGEGKMAKPEPDMRPHIVAADGDPGSPEARISGSSEGDPLQDPGIPMCRPGEFLPDYEFSFLVPDDSMSPMFLKGDVLTCRRVANLSELSAGHPYVFFAGGPGLLRVLARRSPSSLSLHPLNPSWPDTSLRPARLRLTGSPSGLLRRLSFPS